MAAIHAPYPPAAMERAASETRDVPESKAAKISAEETITAINLPRTRRLLIALAFPLFLLAALPYWYATTSIERLPLPVERISTLESARVGATLPLTSEPPYLHEHCVHGRRRGVPAHAGRQGPLSKACQARGTGRGGDQGRGRDDSERVAVEPRREAVGASCRPRCGRRGFLTTGKAASAPLRVHIGVSDTANISWPLEPYVQARRGSVPPGTLVIPVHPSQISDRNLKSKYSYTQVLEWPNPSALQDRPREWD